MKEYIEKREEAWRPDLIERAQRCWNGMSGFRKERARCKRFTYGDQWGDEVPNLGGSQTEAQYLLAQGNMPLTNNLIRRLVRNVLGVFRNQWTLPRCRPRDDAERKEADVMDCLLAYNIERNRLEELYARTMEEFLISGLAVHRKYFGMEGGDSECLTDFVAPERFFIDMGTQDFRALDISIIGEVHDMELPDLCAAFARTEEECREMVAHYGNGNISGFYASSHESGSEKRCRVIEIWNKEYAAGYIGDRWVMEERWRYYFLTPEGRVLANGDTPYAHGSHPYAVKAYPFIDGEIHSFVSDIIDQQKFTNRLISMYDWILRSSAKGVLLFPQESVPDGMNVADLAREWNRFNGIITYKSLDKENNKIGSPEQIHSNLSNLGITDLLNIQLKMMEDISGVNGALQGKLESNSMSGTLYSQQTRNSLIALADLLKTFNDFIGECTAKDVSNIRQFYSPEKIASIVGENPGLHDKDNFHDSCEDFSIEIREKTSDKT